MPFYTSSPPGSRRAASEMIDFLAGWLPSEADASALAGWSEADWETADWVAYWHNVLPWLVSRTQTNAAAIPQRVMERQQVIDAASRARTQGLLDLAATLVLALRAEGGELLPLKGGVLAPVYYPDPLLRPMWDLDLLVQPEFLRPLEALLQARGFSRKAAGLRGVTYAQGQWSPDNVWTPAYQEVEVHTGITHSGAFRSALEAEMTTSLWRGARLQPYWGGVAAYLPTPTALLEHVCLHATQHWFEQRGLIIYVGDVLHLTRRMSAADWQALLAALSPLRARFVYAALAVAGRFGPAPIPPAVLAALAESCSPRLIQWAGQLSLAAVSRSGVSDSAASLEPLFAASRIERAQLWRRKLFPARGELARYQALLPPGLGQWFRRLLQSPLWPLSYAVININRLFLRRRKKQAAPTGG